MQQGDDARRKALKAQVEQLRTKGVDWAGGRDGLFRSAVAETRLLLDMFERNSPFRAADAAAEAHRIFELSLANAPPHDRPIHCAKGCAFCCYLSVAVFAPEAFLLARYLRTQQADAFAGACVRIRGTADRVRGLTSDDRVRAQIPCSMLIDNVCTVHRVRPGACRGLNSFSVAACKACFDGAARDIPLDNFALHARSIQVQAFSAALAAMQMPNKLYEFNDALRIALELDDAERRWLAGEDIFTSVATDTEMEQTMGSDYTSRIEALLRGANADNPVS